MRKIRSDIGIPRTEEVRKKIGDANRGKYWKGDKAKKVAKHEYLNKYHPRLFICNFCGDIDLRTDYANIGHTYSRNKDDYIELCRSCHIKIDKGSI